MSTPNPVHTAYRALYRSWRPQFFSEVVGQEHVVRTLQNALAAGRVAHAYLFCGLRGTGKTTMAKLLAKALNCLEGINPEPCGKCRSCLEVVDGRNMDVLEIDAASNRGIDEIRDLRDKARYAAAQNRFKVYIIDEVHMLTNEAFNALLKILEEPPPQVVFILATTEVYKLPLTVVSRCQRFDFHLLEGKQVVGRLREIALEMDFAVEEETLYLLARQAEGSMRDALGFLEQCRAYGGERLSYGETLEILGLTAPEAIYNLLQAVIEGDNLAGLAVINEVVSKGKNLQRFLREMTLYLRRLVLLQSGGDEEKTLRDVPGLKPHLLKHRDKFNGLVLLEMLEILQDLSGDLKNSSQPSFLLELAFLRLGRIYRFRDYLSPEKLLERLEKLEESLQAAALEGLNAGTVVSGQTPGKEEPDTGSEKAAVAVNDSAADETHPAVAGKTPSEKAEKALSEKALSEKASPVETLPEKEAAVKTPPGKEAAPAPEATAIPEGEAEQEPEQEIDAGSLKEIWENRLLPEIKKQHKHNVYALLQDGRPFSCKKRVFTICLSPKYSFHKGRIESTHNKKYIESLLKNLLGYAVDLRVIMREMPGDTGSAGDIRGAGNTGNTGSAGNIGSAGSAGNIRDTGNVRGTGGVTDTVTNGVNSNRFNPQKGVARREAARGKKAEESRARENIRDNNFQSGESDHFIREMIEIFHGKLIETDGNELKSRDFRSFGIDSLPEETQD